MITCCKEIDMSVDRLSSIVDLQSNIISVSRRPGLSRLRITSQTKREDVSCGLRRALCGDDTLTGLGRRLSRDGKLTAILT